MKTLLMSTLLITSTFANVNGKDNCSEYRLGSSNTYIVQCGEDKYKVTYKNSLKDEYIEFEELGKKQCIRKPQTGNK